MTPDTKRPVLVNRTNAYDNNIKNPWSGLTPLDPVKTKRPAEDLDGAKRKRVKVESKNAEEDSDSSEDVDSDVEMGDRVALLRTRARNRSVFGMLDSIAIGGPSRFRQPSLTTRPILRSFVSSHKSDVYKCISVDANSYLSPPYACSYSNGAKNGGTPLLAVATEQGSIHILNTSKRRDWDVEPQRTTLQPHRNGTFDVKWNCTDRLLATVAGDHFAHVSCSSTGTVLHALRGHTGTVKCAAWDPRHADLLATGGRDGTIRIWDLRTSEGAVKLIGGAHEDLFTKRNGRKSKVLPRSVTSLLYADGGPYGVVSSGSFDGILRFWDLRNIVNPPKKSTTTPLHFSASDPTIANGSRPRGLTSLTAGAGLFFALGADSRVHTYDAFSLTPLAGASFGHPRMLTNSFYVRVAAAPCGRWLASGSTGHEGGAFLFDVADAARTGWGVDWGVDLIGQKGEVGAVDWAADGMLATCAEDGTVRVWRPDMEVRRMCDRNPSEAKWEWSWAEDELEE